MRSCPFGRAKSGVDPPFERHRSERRAGDLDVIPRLVRHRERDVLARQSSRCPSRAAGSSRCGRPAASGCRRRARSFPESRRCPSTTSASGRRRRESRPCESPTDGRLERRRYVAGAIPAEALPPLVAPLRRCRACASAAARHRRSGLARARRRCRPRACGRRSAARRGRRLGRSCRRSAPDTG